MVEFGLDILSKYPFLKEAKDYVASMNLSLGDIQGHPIYSASIELGRQRILYATRGKVADIEAADKLSQELSILSYAVARILINLAGDRALKMRYAAMEAKRCADFLKNERKDMVDEIRDELDMRIEDNRIPLVRYLELTRNLVNVDRKWKLINRQVGAGYVLIDEDEIPLMVREAISEKIIEAVNVSGTPKYLGDMAKQLASTSIGVPESISIKDLNKGALPPCISSMLASLGGGKATHNMMFILGTFFIGTGLGVDDILKVFSVYPKYNEEKTRYQIEFLSGKRGATRYSCPICEKIRSYGLCTSECDVKHPLQYYRMKSRRGFRRKRD